VQLTWKVAGKENVDNNGLYKYCTIANDRSEIVLKTFP
jgi:hypothetical protein